MNPAANALRTAALAAGAVALVAACVLAALIQTQLFFAAAAAAVLVIATAVRPMIGITVWLAALVLIPDWTPLPTGGIGLKPIGAVGVAVVIGVLLSRRRNRSRFAWPDFALLGVMVLLILWVFLGTYPLVLLSNFAGALLVAYVIGRNAPAQIGRAYVIAMLAVAAWGVLEFATGIHVFENWATSDTQHWNEIQTRAGVARSEAGFGHAIAYGAALAMAIPFARELRRGAVPAQLLLFAGVLVSFSRGPIIAAALTLAIAVVFGSKGRKRARDIIVLAIVLVAVLFAFDFLYGEDDASTTALSGQQRGIQLALTLPHVQWFGSEISLEGNRVTSSGSDIIDNTFLRLAINFGWVVAALVLAPMIYAIINLVRGRATAASMALVGQLPVLAVTTLITQWQSAVFLMAGMAVTSLLALPKREKRPRRASRTGASRGASKVTA